MRTPTPTPVHDGRVTTIADARPVRFAGDGDLSVASLRVREDGGYVMALTALMIIPLIVFLAMAIDLGSFYANGSKLQRAADAAAMAGVVWMPNTATAQTEATRAANANGFSSGSGVTVTGTPVGSNQYKVTITSPATRFFSQVFQGGTYNMTRTATAQFNKPIPMGSPTNAMGNNMNPASCAQYQPTSSAPCGPQPFVWSAINGPYDDKRNGDQYSTKCGAGSSGTGCTQSNVGVDYRTTGFDFAIDVAAADVGTPLTVQAYDLGAYPRRAGRSSATSSATRSVMVNTTNGSTTMTSATANFTAADVGLPVYGIPSSGTRTISSVTNSTTVVLSGSANQTKASMATIGYDCNSNKAPFNNSTYSSFTSPNWNFLSGFSGGNCQTGDDTDGQNMDVQLYANDGSDLTVDISTPDPTCHLGPIDTTTFTTNTNTYKNAWVTVCTFTPTMQGIYPLKVRNSGFGTPADAGSGTNAYALKATGGTGTRMYALNDMSIFTNSPGSTARFYLAEIKPEHAGKKLIIDLYDPGDGNAGNYFLQILGPAAGGGASPLPASPTSGTVIPATNMVTSCNYNATPSPTKGPATPNVAATCNVQTASGGSGWYNGNYLRFSIQLSTNYTCGVGSIPDCWWSVSYQFGSAGFPTDRTVWSINVVGDPVHLVN